eukprot:jgi/Galph1/2168/GphlegSOOS_G857.1
MEESDKILQLAKDVYRDRSQVCESLATLRCYLLKHALPLSANQFSSDGTHGSRAVVWKALLGVGKIDVSEYERLIAKGPSKEHLRIREDALRTFRHDTEFQERVPEEKLVRLLSAFVHWSENTSYYYRGGMNCLCAPFLYLMSEPEAFACFCALISKFIPQYVKYDKAVELSGANIGCKLLSSCLSYVEPDLFAFLEQHCLGDATLYAFPTVSTLGANIPPLEEILRLWDIQLLLVPILIFCLLFRDFLFQRMRPMQILNSLIGPRRYDDGYQNDAEILISKAIEIARKLPEDLYCQLSNHTQTTLMYKF